MCVADAALSFHDCLGMRGSALNRCWCCAADVRQISLQSVLVYFWGCVVAASPMIVFSVAAFDFLDYLKSWLKHHWVDSSFRFIREAFCEPGTANKECMAPVNGGSDYTSVDEWCEAMFNSTACAEITKEAQDDAFSFTGRMLRLQGSVGILNVIQLFYAMAVCSFILTKTVIMETMNDVINYLLLIPVAGCLLMGYARASCRRIDCQNI